MMDEARFWSLIDQARRKAKRLKPEDGDEFLEHERAELQKLLVKLTPEEIVAFDRRFDHFFKFTNRRELYAAIYLLDDGCGSDSFLDFGACLISLGKTLFHKVLKDPDSLADVVERPDVPGDMTTEGFQYVAMHAYQEKTGRELPQESDADDEEEDDWEFDYTKAELKRLFPKLWARASD